MDFVEGLHLASYVPSSCRQTVAIRRLLLQIWQNVDAAPLFNPEPGSHGRKAEPQAPRLHKRFLSRGCVNFPDMPEELRLPLHSRGYSKVVEFATTSLYKPI